ncbi:MAG: TRAM domain-containing protein [Halobacteria archaeon]|nr:TRAM domain-containing protein [Halobacteria archaeon]
MKLIPEDLLCLFNSRVEERDGSYVIEVPKTEIEFGEIEERGSYRFGVFESPSNPKPKTSSTGDTTGIEDNGSESYSPPVEKGEIREVTIESLGDDGDGVAKVDGNFVIFVPNTDVDDTVTIRIDDVKKTFAKGEVIKQGY